MRWPLLAPAVGLALLGWTPPAPAQVQEIVEAEVPQINQNNGFFVVQEQFEINQATFDQWIYGNRLRNSTALEYLESLLNVRLTEVERACRLAEGQKQRLRLAGHGDIKRFHDRVAEVRADFDRLKRDQARMNELFQQVQPLAAQLNAGLFGDGSFFAKSIGTTLSPEQKEQAQAAARAKAKYRFQGRVLLAVAGLDATVGFSADQQRRYVAAIMDQATPPDPAAGAYEANVVLLKIAQVPEATIRPIFDDDQWSLLQKQFAQARAMEPFLRSAGHLGAGKVPRDQGAAVVGLEPPVAPIRIDRAIAK